MGYFSNGTQGMHYEAQYCNQCIHQHGPDGKSGCAIWLAHMIHNYDECTNEASILDILIPRTKDKLDNERCSLFRPTARPNGGEPVPELTETDKKYLAWKAEQEKPVEIPLRRAA